MLHIFGLQHWMLLLRCCCKSYKSVGTAAAFYFIFFFSCLSVLDIFRKTKSKAEKKRKRKQQLHVKNWKECCTWVPVHDAHLFFTILPFYLVLFCLLLMHLFLLLGFFFVVLWVIFFLLLRFIIFSECDERSFVISIFHILRYSYICIYMDVCTRM